MKEHSKSSHFPISTQFTVSAHSIISFPNFTHSTHHGGSLRTYPSWEFSQVKDLLSASQSGLPCGASLELGKDWTLCEGTTSLVSSAVSPDSSWFLGKREGLWLLSSPLCRQGFIRSSECATSPV